MAVKIVVKEGDTWAGIAARELGNETLGREIAGFNGLHENGSPPVGEEVSIPYREAPKEDSDTRGRNRDRDYKLAEES